MFTYRTGAGGEAGVAAAMANHLLQPTEPAASAALAAYYDRASGADDADFSATIPQVRSDADPAIADLLGVDLGRPPTRDELAHLLAGRRADGLPIAGMPDGRRCITFVDCCFSADKSLSLAIQLAPTAAERGLLQAVHRDAAAATMRSVEAVIGQARRGKAGRGGAEPGAMLWIAVEHHTARPTVAVATRDQGTGESYSHLATIPVQGAPQAHVHHVLVAVVRTPSGHVGAPHLAALKGRVREWGAEYQARAATGLRALGVDVVLDLETGAARLAAIPDVVRSAFSKRTTEGEAAARAYARSRDLDWDTLGDRARIVLMKEGTQGNPRAPKRDDVSDVDTWRREAAALGWTPSSVIDLNAPILLPALTERMAIARAAAEPFLAAAFASAAVIDMSVVREAAARGLVASGMESAAEIDAVAEALLAGGIVEDGHRTAVVVREVPTVNGKLTLRLTTEAHLARERQIVALARAAASDKSDALTPAEIAAAAASSGLDFSGEHGQAQGEAMRALGSGGKVGLLLGASGAGKTTTLGPLVSAWTASGRQVFGTAPAWRQALALSDAGIPAERCMAVAALLARANDLRLASGAVILVDETSLLSTQSALDLLKLREATGAILIAVGDPLQGDAVGVGGIIRLLQRAIGDAVPEITATVRQRAARERELADMARAGRFAGVLDALRWEGRAILAPGMPSEVVEAAADLWRERADAVGENAVIVVAPTRADCRMVGAAIRRHRQMSGCVGPDLAEIDACDQAGDAYTMPLGLGDRLRVFGKVYAKGGGSGLLGVNGSTLTVLGIEPAGLILRADSGRQGLVTWASLRDPDTGRIRIAMGYAHTIAAAQGATAQEACLVLPNGSAGMGAAQAYVALTRHRDRSWIVLGEGAERQAVAARRPLNDARPIRTPDIWAHAAANFARRPASEGALDLLERARLVRRQAEHAFRLGLARIEARQLGERPATLVPAHRRHRQIAHALVALTLLVRERGEAIAALASRITQIARGQRPRRRVRSVAPAPVLEPRP